MLKRVRWLPLATLAVFVACQDVSGPVQGGGSSAIRSVAPAVANDVTSDSLVHLLRQAGTAPALQTYQVSFWVRHDREAAVTVNYQGGAPFLYFDVPANALFSRPDGSKYHGRDSVLMTMTIDPVRFLVEFQPSGLVFKPDHQALLAIWYENANPDLNGDGVVDATDAALLQRLHIVYRSVKHAHWNPQNTTAGNEYVFAQLRHFSEYAVSW